MIKSGELNERLLKASFRTSTEEELCDLMLQGADPGYYCLETQLTSIHRMVAEDFQQALTMAMGLTNNIDQCAHNEQETPLHWASELGRAEAAVILVNAGASLEARNYKKETPLHLACVKNNMLLASALINAGADIEAKDESEKTPLHMACEGGHSDLALMLLAMGANVSAENTRGRNPVDLARRKNRTETISAIEAFLGAKAAKHEIDRIINSPNQLQRLL